jgi:hypothetical protein
MSLPRRAWWREMGGTKDQRTSSETAERTFREPSHNCSSADEGMTAHPAARRGSSLGVGAEAGRCRGLLRPSSRSNLGQEVRVMPVNREGRP